MIRVKCHVGGKDSGGCMMECYVRQVCGLRRAKGQQGHISELVCVLFGHEWQEAQKSHFIQLVAARIRLGCRQD